MLIEGNMLTKPNPDQKILQSWQKNVKPWVQAIAQDEITTRIATTNQAIVDAVRACEPSSLLDVGCGEGWLLRALADDGLDYLGIDGVAGFADYVQASGGRFRQLAYEELSFKTLQRRFDLLVCNFSLLGEQATERVVMQAPGLLNPGGRLLIQTLHPQEVGGDYVDGWRTGSWAGFNAGFVEPPPWYFRTVESWQALTERAGFTDVELMAPRCVRTGRRMSLLLSGMMPGP